MKVTYINHSGFLVETRLVNLLFDYGEGELPKISEEKPLMVFISHSHRDHYNPAVFHLAKHCKNIHYFISKDIRISEEITKEYELTQEFLNQQVTYLTFGVKRIVPLIPSNQDYGYMTLETIKSTDQGLAYLVTIDGKTIYHAGDLNCWVWEEDTKQQYNNMSAMFKRIMEYLSGREIYLAFAPLDPRQGRFYKISMEYLLNAAQITYAVPMHLWGEYDWIDRYEKERVTKDLPTKILKFSEKLEYKEI